jgi:hypothetical protein
VAVQPQAVAGGRAAALHAHEQVARQQEAQIDLELFGARRHAGIDGLAGEQAGRHAGARQLPDDVAQEPQIRWRADRGRAHHLPHDIGGGGEVLGRGRVEAGAGGRVDDELDGVEGAGAVAEDVRHPVAEAMPGAGLQVREARRRGARGARHHPDELARNRVRRDGRFLQEALGQARRQGYFISSATGRRAPHDGCRARPKRRTRRRGAITRCEAERGRWHRADRPFGTALMSACRRDRCSASRNRDHATP